MDWGAFVLATAIAFVAIFAPLHWAFIGRPRAARNRAVRQRLGSARVPAGL